MDATRAVMTVVKMVPAMAGLMAGQMVAKKVGMMVE